MFPDVEGGAEVYFLNQLAWDLLQACGKSSGCRGEYFYTR